MAGDGTVYPIIIMTAKIANAPNSIQFSGPVLVQEVGLHHKEASWFSNNLARVMGGLRIVSHSMSIVSGSGIGSKPSPFRVATGALGASASLLLMLFGEKAESRQQKLASAQEEDAGFIQKLQPKNNIINLSSFIFMMSGITLLISGILSKRPFEAVSGGISTVSFGLQHFLSEAPDINAPKNDIKFDGPTDVQHVGTSGKSHSFLQDLIRHPMKLSAALLQVNVLLILADAITNRDPTRAVSGSLLGLSNLTMAFMRKNDYDYSMFNADKAITRS